MNANAMVQDPMALIDEVESGIKAEVIKTDPVEMAKVHIEGFTKEDFEGKAPYMYVLMNHGGMKSDYATLKAKLLEQAHIVKYGRRNAQTKMTAYEEENPDLVPKLRAVAPIVACEGFSGMDRFFGDNAVNYGSYTCTDAGISGTDRFGIPFEVCTEPIIISRRGVNVDDERETVDISFHQDGIWKTIKNIAKRDVSDDSKLGAILADRGVNVNPDTRKRISVFLCNFDAANRSIIPRVKTTSNIGWTANNTFAPITGDVILGAFDNDDFAAIAKAINAGGDEKVWYDGVKALRAAKWSLRSRIAMAGAFASPMISKLHILPFWIHLEGKTGTAKTVTLRLCASIYAFTDETGGYMRTMDSTKTGLEVLAGFIRHMPLCLNEMQRVKNPKENPKLVYMITEGGGRTRGAKDGGLRNTLSWSCVPISTGEGQIVTAEDEGGANNRVIAIRIKDDDALIPNGKEFCGNVLDKSWGHAAKPWIEGIKDLDYDALRKEIIEISSRLQAKGKAEKQSDAAAVLLVADRLAEEIIFKDGIRITEDDILPFLKDKNFVDDRLRAYEVVCSLISENANNFVTNENREPAKTWGKFEDDGNKVYFDKNILEPTLRERKIDPSLFIDWCIDHKVVEDGRLKGDHQHKAIRTRIRKSTPWCYVFDMTVDPTGRVPAGYKEVSENDPVQTELPF